MRLTVIVPTLNEGASIHEHLAGVLGGLVKGDELFVVDGGSADGTLAKAAKAGARVLLAPTGRGVQLNAGAKAASGDVLLFLHADTRLPDGFRGLLVECLSDPNVGWGRFDLRFDEGGALLLFIAWLISRRSRLTKGATGDQAMFVRYELFERVKGFHEPLLFEDVDLSRRLRGLSQMGIPKGHVVTSSRRWRQGGTWRTTFLMWGMKTAYLCGVPADRLIRFYRNVR
ncbi:MAG: rSAM/selenodomain-associated transferase 2 [Hyphomicrobiaceae bacterium]